MDKAALAEFGTSVSLIPFDEAWYCRQHPDVARAVQCGVVASAHAHFLNYGFFEGRSPGPDQPF